MKAILMSLLIAGLAVTGLLGWLISENSAAVRDSLYVPMQDGTRIAVDVWLPANRIAEERLPTVLRATRYWRGYELGPMGRTVAALGLMNLDAEAGQWAREGYALVTVDVRGSGASFGQWDIVWSPQEVADLGDIVDWIVAQPWSNGRVGAYGVSYDGNAAELLAVTEHPAVKAVAPQYSDFDVHRQLLFPGGVYNRGFIEAWDEFTYGLDRNDPCALAAIVGQDCGSLRAVIAGVRPVDDTPERCGASELAAAVATHRPVDLSGAAGKMEFADDPFGDSGLTLTDVSPYTLREPIERSNVPMYVWASWIDGVSAEGALSRFATFSNPQKLIVGAWSHGGEADADPFRPARAAPSPSMSTQFAKLAEFFDCYLKPIEFEEPTWEIAYYTLGEGSWRTTDVWPPNGFEATTWWFGEGGSLRTLAPNEGDAADDYTVDWTATTGSATRWHTNLTGGDIVYPDRASEDAKLLTYTSEPLAADTEITGAPVVTLYVSSTHDDGAFHVYLEDVSPDGRVTYITEGILRAAHRAVSDPPYVTTSPFHSLEREDARPLVPGDVAELPIGLYSTSVLIRAGHRIRIAIAGHDACMFERIPADGTPTITVHRSAEFPSGVVLPMKTAYGSGAS